MGGAAVLFCKEIRKLVFAELPGCYRRQWGRSCSAAFVSHSKCVVGGARYPSLNANSAAPAEPSRRGLSTCVRERNRDILCTRSSDTSRDISHTVLRYLRSSDTSGSPALPRSSAPSRTEIRSGPGGTGGVGRRRRLGSLWPRPDTGDVGINPGLAASVSPGPSEAVEDSLASPRPGPSTDLPEPVR